MKATPQAMSPKAAAARKLSGTDGGGTPPGTPAGRPAQAPVGGRTAAPVGSVAIAAVGQQAGHRRRRCFDRHGQFKRTGVELRTERAFAELLADRRP